MSIREYLHEIVIKAPEGSGVYLWRDKDDAIIYVGKAKSLKNRLSSYFAKHKDIKTRILMSHAAQLEYIETKTEYEALLLENTLIKKHRPKYNINLKDGKTYPLIKLTNEDFPAIFKTRNLRNDGSFYFGPFPNVYAVENFLRLIKQNYKLRECKVLRKRKNPCLYYHMKLCFAPCCGKVSVKEYAKEVEVVKKLLTNTSSLKELKKQMQEASKALDFEKAKRLRDGIHSVLALHNQNVVEDLDKNSRDYVAWASEGAIISLAVLKMRNGKLVARDLYKNHSLKQDSEILQEFLPMYYKSKDEVPPIIFVLTSENTTLETQDSTTVMENWFKKELKTKTKIISLPILLQSSRNSAKNYVSKDGTSEAAEPASTFFASELKKTVSVSSDDDALAKKFGMTLKDFRHHRAALSMAYFNAKEDVYRRLREHGDWQGVEDLKKVLRLDILPSRIEGFDIAHLQGTHTVGSLISFKDGIPEKKNYRLFKLRTTANINNDYESMREIVARQYTRLINENAELPDLILIDGGLGQVNAAYSILCALNLHIPIIGLAEQNEEVYFPNNSKPLILQKKSPALQLLQRVRDESHRFANKYNNKLRKKSTLCLEFEKLPHVGSVRAKILLKKFGTMEKLSQSAPAEISEKLRVNKRIATEIWVASKGI